jgi:hypothetical protein
MRRYWYGYLSGDTLNPNRYEKIFFNPNNICFGGPTLCAIYSFEDRSNPNIPTSISENMKIYMIAAKSTNKAFPVFPNKPYVYVKPSC